MGRRGPLRTGLRDKLQREKSSAGKPTKKTPSKRQKTTITNGCPTPFVSTTTGQVYTYDYGIEEPNTFIKCSPVNSQIDVPASCSAFLMKAASNFAKKVNDVLVSPELLVINFTMDPERLPEYYKFCKPGKHRIPNSDCFLQVESSHIEDILTEHYDFDFTTFGKEDSVFMETSSSSSDDSDLEMEPVPAKPTVPVTITELPSKSPAAAGAPSTAATTPAPDQAKAVPVAENSRTSASANPKDDSATAPAATVKSKPRGRARFTKVDFSKLEVEVPPPPKVLTILFRTTSEKDSLKNVHPLKLSKELVSKGGDPTDVRDIRNGGLAIDFAPETPSLPLLEIKTLQGIQVQASLPLTRDYCSGVASGIHWELSEEEIVAEMQTLPPTQILSAKRLAKPGQQSWVVKLTFQGIQIPERALLGGRSHKIKPYQDRPLQCLNCARYGHTARLCKSSKRCWTCGQAHDTASCPNQAAPSCTSCGGPHPANSSNCPARGFQTKVCEVRAATNSTFKEARKAVTEAARSYASAVRQGPQPKPAQKQQTKPANKPASQPASKVSFLPNIAHVRAPQPPASAASLATIFHGLVSIMSDAITKNDFQGALSKMADLFLSQAPGADPDLFRVSP